MWGNFRISAFLCHAAAHALITRPPSRATMAASSTVTSSTAWRTFRIGEDAHIANKLDVAERKFKQAISQWEGQPPDRAIHAKAYTVALRRLGSIYLEHNQYADCISRVAQARRVLDSTTLLAPSRPFARLSLANTRLRWRTVIGPTP